VLEHKLDSSGSGRGHGWSLVNVKNEFSNFIKDGEFCDWVSFSWSLLYCAPELGK
jgi:hypothetical protein